MRLLRNTDSDRAIDHLRQWLTPGASVDLVSPSFSLWVLPMITAERELEELLVVKLQDLKYQYRPDIRDRATLEANSREKFEALKQPVAPAQ